MKEACGNSPSSRWAVSPVKLGEPRSSARETPDAFSSSSEHKFGEAHAPSKLVHSRIPLAVLIPAYQPGAVVSSIVQEIARREWETIVIVDDGSGASFSDIFAELRRIPKVHVISHAVNLGKGAAIKTGINFILCAYPNVGGIITVDADGQHDPADVERVAERFQHAPDALVLGVRAFDGRVPLRSRLGNQITRRVIGALVGHHLTDSQTGLRAIPKALLPTLLKVPSSGYEFELEMLIAVKHRGVRIIETPIRTIYAPGNPSSHFQPLRDSMRIYYVLLRFTFIGLLTAALDNLAFFLTFHLTGGILESQIAARLAAVVFNYTSVKRAVFLFEEQHKILLPRYLLVLLTHATLSYLGIRLLGGFFSMNVLVAKVSVETLLFFVNFAIQRDFVFTRITPLGAEACAQEAES